MSPLFRKNEEKAAQEAAALSELERLRALAPAALSTSKFNPLQLLIPVREGLQSVKHADLVSSSGLERTSIRRTTRLGDERLAEGASTH